MLMGSNAHAIGEAALCSVDLRRLIRTSGTCAAIAFEAVGANPTALDVRVHAARQTTRTVGLLASTVELSWWPPSER